MFNISKDFAPPFKMIEPFFKFGSIAYLLSIFALLFIDSSGDIHNLKIVGWAHLTWLCNDNYLWSNGSTNSCCFRDWTL